MVSAGELAICGDRDRKLVTCVGSCVAVALYEPRLPLAGLLHAVFPRKGRFPQREQTDAFFVDSGVKELLAGMLERGANAENLVASLVGGASLLGEEGTGPAIGSRNVEAAREALSRAGIGLRLCEAGGNRPWTVELEVESGALKVNTMAHCDSPPAPKDAPTASAGEWDRLARMIDGLRPHRRVAGELLAATHETEFPWKRAAAIISRDTILALRFFRLANSGSFGYPHGIGSLESAQERLGSKQLRRLCVMAATGRQSRSPQPELGELSASLSHHCLASAVIARSLAETGCPEKSGEAFSASLLHGVGTLGAALLKKEEGDGSARVDPCLLGGAILAGWNLPGGIVKAVSGFGQPAQDSPGESPLTALNRLACGMARMLGIICPQETVCLPPSAADLRRAGVSGSLEELLFAMYEKLRGRGLLAYLIHHFRDGMENS